MKKLLVAAAAVALTGTANAQSAFEGAYGQIGIGFQSTSPTASSAVTFDTGSGFASTIGAGYNFAIDKSFLLGIGVDYNPFESQSTNYTASVNGTYKTKNTYNIFITPGLVIDKNSLAYAKVGYTGSTFQTSDRIGTDNYNMNGYSLGLGYKQIITGGIYGFAEGNYLMYNNKDFGGGVNVKQNTYNLLVGVGYAF